MWNVTSQTRKAIPGLGALLLGLILLACIVFAHKVLEIKHQQFGLKLDRSVAFNTPAGEFKIKLSSKWTRLSSERMSDSAVGGWSFALPGESSPAFFYLELLPIHPSTDLDLSRVINHFLPNAPKYQVHWKNGTSVSADLKTLDVDLLYPTERGANIFLMRLFYLPNGTSLVMIITGSQENQDILQVWMDLVSDTLEPSQSKPANSTPQAPPKMEGPYIQTSIIGTHAFFEGDLLHVANL